MCECLHISHFWSSLVLNKNSLVRDLKMCLTFHNSLCVDGTVKFSEKIICKTLWCIHSLNVSALTQVLIVYIIIYYILVLAGVKLKVI